MSYCLQAICWHQQVARFILKLLVVESMDYNSRQGQVQMQSHIALYHSSEKRSLVINFSREITIHFDYNHKHVFT